MAAGLGFKDFTTGEVLTAADVDGYLMQGVWVFASAAARDAAVTSPQEGNFAYLKDTNVTTYYTGSAWANLDTTGMTNPMTTTGDTIYSSSGSTPARLGIGSTGNVLTVSGGVPTWAAPAGGGGMTLISETVASGLSSLSLSSIAGTYKQLILIWFGVYHSDNSTVFSIRLNNDSTANAYPINAMSGAGTTGFYNGPDQNTYIIVPNSAFNLVPFGESTNASSTNLYQMAQGFMTIDNYASTTKVKNIQSHFGYYKNAGTTGYANALGIGQWKDTSAVTSIDVVRISGSGTFSNASNTSIRLYGVA